MSATEGATDGGLEELPDDHPLREHRDALVDDMREMSLADGSTGKLARVLQSRAVDRIYSDERASFTVAREIIEGYDGASTSDRKAPVRTAATAVAHTAIDVIEDGEDA